MARKLLSIMLSLFIVISIWPIAVNAEDTNEMQETHSNNEYEYSINNNEVTITKYIGNKTAVIVPDTIDDYPVTSIGSYAFSGCSSLTELTLPESVTSLGSEIIKGTHIESIIIPKNASSNSITSPFFNASFLKEIIFEEGMKRISAYFCDGVHSLEKVSIPSTVTIIDTYAFANTNISEINLSKNLEYLGYGFIANTSIKRLIIPSGIIRAGYRTNGNGPLEGASLKELVFSEGLTAIPAHFCDGVKSLEKVHIPSTVTYIAQRAFAYNTMSSNTLTNIYFYGDAPGIDSQAFYVSDINAYYPADNLTWTENKLIYYSASSIEWAIWMPGDYPRIKTYYNGNRYDIFDKNMNWFDANAYCESLGGHLVTITSAEEDEAVQKIIAQGSMKQYWTGLYRKNASLEHEWVTGEAVSYTHWDIGQPDTSPRQSDGQYELYVEVYNTPDPYKINSKQFGWNDIFYDNTYPGQESFFSLSNIGFICEWDLEEQDPSNISLSFTDEIYYGKLNEWVQLTGLYKGNQVDNFEVEFSDPDAFEEIDKGVIPGAENNEHGLLITLKALKLGVFDVTVKNGDLSATVQVSVSEEGEDPPLRTFTLEKDNNNYIHSDDTDWDGAGFVGVTDYSIDDAYYKILVSNSDKAERDSIKIDMSKPWDGSCYGIAASIGQLYNKYIDIGDLTEDTSPKSYYELSYPSENPRLLNAINTLQLSQNLAVGGKKYASVSQTYGTGFINGLTNFFAGGDSLNVFLRKLYDYCWDNEVVLLGFSYPDENGKVVGHSVLTVGASYDAIKDQYYVKIYDENSVRSKGASGSFSKLEISKDYSSFSLVDARGRVELTNDTFLNMYFVDWSKLFNFNHLLKCDNEQEKKASNSKDDMIIIKLRAGQAVTIKNHQAETLKYDGNLFSGDMPVYGLDSVENGETTYYLIHLADSDSFNIVSDDKNYDIEVYNQNELISAEGTKIDSLQIDIHNGIKLTGKDYQFKSYVSTDEITENENGLISVSGHAISDVQLSRIGLNVKVLSENDITDITTCSYEGVERIEEHYEQVDGEFMVSEDAKITDEPEQSETITLSNNELSILCGEAKKLNATVVPNTQNKSVSWSSSNESIATVDQNGLVTGVKPGLAIITATTVNGLTATCEVRVLFTDVANGGKYYFNPVYWAVDKAITTGTSPSTFEPNAYCTREQFVTFLWRLRGEPEPKTTSNFADVAKDKWYYKAITWAFENGITTGVNSTNFGVGQACTREQCVTFLFRAAGSPGGGAWNPFTDVKSEAYYYSPVLWAAGNNITTGLNDGTGRFGVGQKCTRGMLVTFLYRFAEYEEEYQ